MTWKSSEAAALAGLRAEAGGGGSVPLISTNEGGGAAGQRVAAANSTTFAPRLLLLPRLLEPESGQTWLGFVCWTWKILLSLGFLLRGQPLPS